MLKAGEGGQIPRWRMRNLVIYRGRADIEGGGVLDKLTLAGLLAKLGDPQVTRNAKVEA